MYASGRAQAAAISWGAYTDAYTQLLSNNRANAAGSNDATNTWRSDYAIRTTLMMRADYTFCTSLVITYDHL